MKKDDDRTAFDSLRFAFLFLAVLSISCTQAPRVPDRLVVLTFDDGNKTDRDFVGPLLEEYGFGGTFFVNKAGGAFGHPDRFLTWDDVEWLHERGFEIGNHTANHPDVRRLSKEEFAAELEVIERACLERGIPRPKSFCYCGYRVSREALEVLEERGYLLARRGVAPEFPMTDRGDRGPTYDPEADHPLLVPTTFASGPNFQTFDDFVSIVEQAKDGRIVVLTFHGIPTDLHPWVHTDPETFRRYMDYLREHQFRVVALRDVWQFVRPPERRTTDPFEPIDRRLRIVPTELRSDGDSARPTFHWTCRSAHGQKPSAYQVLVASSPEKLALDEGDLWDSGKVVSTRTSGIPYEGRLENDRKGYWWKVRVWNRLEGEILERLDVFDASTANDFRKERPGPYSEPAVWTPRSTDGSETRLTVFE